MLTKWSVADIRIGWEENAATKREDSEAEHIIIITKTQCKNMNLVFSAFTIRFD